MKSYCMEHRDFTNWTAIVDFEELYLGPQMELEGMLWRKINQFRMYKRMGTTPDTHIPSKLENSSPSLFFVKINVRSIPTFCQLTTVNRQKVRLPKPWILGISRKKRTFLFSFPQEVSLHLLACSIVRIG